MDGLLEMLEKLTLDCTFAESIEQPASNASPNVASQVSPVRAQPTLLTLPPELRNRIYREVLVEDTITILSNTVLPVKPGFLRTCKLVRKEALSIYYKENAFTFNSIDYDARPYIKWCKSGILRRHANIHFRPLRTDRNWPNLMVWVKAYYHRECGPPCNARNPDTTRYVYLGVFGMARKMRKSGMKWKIAKEVLAEMRQALAAEDARWAEGEVDD